jgi:hypothetical protein
LPGPLEAALKIREATDARPEIRGDIAMDSCGAKPGVLALPVVPCLEKTKGRGHRDHRFARK